MKFHILGCGPAGLMSAHAASNCGYEVVIHSKKRKSEMYGAQYLHEPIPGFPSEPFEVSYELRGDGLGYREKVYGKTWDGKVSPEDLLGSHTGWDIRDTYNRLWGLYSPLIERVSFNTPGDVVELVSSYPGEDIWASSIPAPILCLQPKTHAFSAQQVYAIGDAPERGIFSPVQVPLNTVVCNGEPTPSWYRASNILGYHTVEWPEGKKPPIEGVSLITKPLSTTCDCFPYIHRVGRYGKWMKGVLSHEAYVDTWNGMATVNQGPAIETIPEMP